MHLNLFNEKFPQIRFTVQNLVLHQYFLFFHIEEQKSITGSNDSTSLDSRSYIAPFRSSHDQDIESHASLIPAPRSTTASITSSLENVHMKSAASGSNIVVCGSLPEVSCEESFTTAVKSECLSSIVQQQPDALSPSSPTSQGAAAELTQQIVAPCAVPEGRLFPRDEKNLLVSLRIRQSKSRVQNLNLYLHFKYFSIQLFDFKLI